MVYSGTYPVELPTLGLPRGIIADIVPSTVLSDRSDRDIRMERSPRRHKDGQDPSMRFGLRFGALGFECDPVVLQDLQTSLSGSEDRAEQGVSIVDAPRDADKSPWHWRAMKQRYRWQLSRRDKRLVRQGQE
jgi:hypothetical protein